MRAQEYVEAFPRTLPAYEADLAEPWRLEDPHEQSLGWSYRFGKLLHAQLLGQGPEAESPMGPGPFQLYADWNFRIAKKQFLLFDDHGEDREHRNAANFHALNRNIMPMWNDFFSAEIQTRMPLRAQMGRRQYMLELMQQALAQEAMIYLLSRDQYIKDKGGTHALFKQEKLPDGRLVPRGGFTELVGGAIGVMEEFDLAIGGVEALRRYPDLLGENTLLLPGPVQFEKTNRATNADLIYYDPTPGQERAIGLQAKMSVNHEDVRAIDPNRVVLFDGKIDFNSVLSVRTTKGSSEEAVVAWPGMLAAKIMSQLKVTGKRRSPIIEIGQTPAALLASRGVGKIKGQTRAIKDRGVIAGRMSHLQDSLGAIDYAKGLIGNIKIDLDQVAKIIAERVAPKL